jgi:membrane fusion protein (multidrug efflux system)
MAAAIRVELKNIPNALLVPEEAIIRQGTKRLVYTVGPEQTVTPTEIRLGQFFMNRVQIEQGVSPGDHIVVAGHQKLGPGVKVAPQPYEPVVNPNLGLGADNNTMDCEF